MNRLFLLFLFSSIYADQVEVFTNSLSSKNKNIFAKEEVVISYKKNLFKSDYAKYNIKNKKLLLKGSVEIIGYEDTKEYAKEVNIDIKNSNLEFKNLFAITSDDIWVLALKGKKENKKYFLKESFLSSCNIKNPLWKLYFKEAIYENSKMKLYNTKIYIKNTPIFYTPYLTFSTKRSSGLLFPWIGYNQREGFIYEQPLYLAISNKYDLEINPQLRTNRSIGVYSTFRFANKTTNKNVFRMGYFKDFTSYTKEQNLSSSKHYGVELHYQTNSFFNLDSLKQEGLYLDAIMLSDIEYLNLQRDRLGYFGTTPLQESRLNYFASTNRGFLGIYNRYFIDTRKSNNEDTLQLLPSINLHKYLTPIYNNILYSLDLKVNNLKRVKDIELSQVEATIPISFTTSFFNDFLNLRLKEKLYYSKYMFYNGDFQYDRFEYSTTKESIKLFSNLTKSYKKLFIHTISPTITYEKPGQEIKRPQEYLLTKEQSNLFSIPIPKEQVKISLSQYFYSPNAKKLNFYQRFNLIYKDKTWNDINNEMGYYGEAWSLYNYSSYALNFKKLRESSTLLSLKKNKGEFNLGYNYKRVLGDEIGEAVDTNDINLNLKYKVNSKLKIYAGFSSNIHQEENSLWNLGGKYQKKCWGVDFSFKQVLTPRPNGTTRDSSFSFEFNFLPFNKSKKAS